MKRKKNSAYLTLFADGVFNVGCFSLFGCFLELANPLPQDFDLLVLLMDVLIDLKVSGFSAFFNVHV